MTDDSRSMIDVLEIAHDRGLSHVKVGVFDVDGVLRGKYMSLDKLESALVGGFGVCDVVLGWDVNDSLYDNVTYTGWHTGYPDAQARLIPSTMRELPYENDMVLVLGEFTGAAEAVCPRGALRRIIERAKGLGFGVKAGFEFEFFMFDETPTSAAKKGYRNLKSMTPGNFGYSVLRSSVWSSLYHEMMAVCAAMDIPLEGVHEESGPGVLEAAITVDEGLRAADKAALFKTFAKVVAQKNDLMATFMARYNTDLPGSSGHIHMSLVDDAGEPVFYDPAGQHTMSKTMRHFLAGQQRLMPEVLAMIAPTVNSYKRLVPGYWAPTGPTWGVENRTCALRIIAGSPKSQRVEYRIAGADSNPYIALAAALGSGLWGIEHELEPTEAIIGNAYTAPPPDGLKLPVTLSHAAGTLARSDAARELFGGAFVDHFSQTRAWEAAQFRKHVTDWELKRYFEII